MWPYALSETGIIIYLWEQSCDENTFREKNNQDQNTYNIKEQWLTAREDLNKSRIFLILNKMHFLASHFRVCFHIQLPTTCDKPTRDVESMQVGRATTPVENLVGVGQENVEKEA